MEEEFKDIPGYEGIYQISRNCQVKSLERYDDNRYGTKSLKKEKILKPGTKRCGYKYVILTSYNKCKISKDIHQLIYLTFEGEYDTKYDQIDHIDRNRSNNTLSNLRLVSRRTNHNNRTDQSLFGSGVTKTLYNKYQTQIVINNKRIHLGNYKTPEQAHNKYLEVKNQIEEIEKVTRNYNFIRTKIRNEYFIELFPIIEPS